MPLLGADDPLPRRPQRVLVAGASGSGKTTVARRVAAALDLPRVELDALFHGPGCVPRPEFAAEVAALCADERWVTEWQYAEVRELLAARAELVVWLDLSRARVMTQLLRRTVVRRLRREQLWNGNVEPPLRTVLDDPEHILRWAWSSHARMPAEVERLRHARPRLDVVRLRSRSEVERWCRSPLRDASADGRDG